MSLSEAVREALQEPNPHDSELKVQELVARHIAALTPGTTVKRTGYFNHSWAPDLVVTSGDQEERRFYLRFDVKNPSFMDDLRWLSKDRPAFLDLVAANPNAEPTPEPEQVDLRATLNEDESNEVLVTEVPAVDHFRASVDRNGDIKTATQQVVLGGRGVVDEPVADRIVGSWARANEAIAEGEPGELRAAMDDVEHFLSRVASLDLETDLRSRWIGRGQSAESFPGREDWSLDDRAPWEIARLVLALLKQDPPVGDDRWESIAQAIDASTLGHELFQIGEYHQGGAVNDLVRVGLPYWMAQYAYVPPLEADSLERFDWAIGSYSFELNLVRRRAFFTNAGRKWNRMPRSDVLPSARDRIASLADSGVTGVGLVTTEERISHELRPTARASLAQRLEPFLEDEGDSAYRAARIQWLEAKVPGTSAIAHVDFDRSVVDARQPIPLKTYALLVGRLVAGLIDNEQADLELALDGEAASESAGG